MKINQREFKVHELRYIIRSAVESDANNLSEVRLQIDGETENLDRERGEAYIDAHGFKRIIIQDAKSPNGLFLVSTVNQQIVGYSRCEGSPLKRTCHKVEFGVGVLKDYWGYGIGTNLLRESIRWADSSQIQKMNLSVLETNHRAIKLYQTHGFEVEGTLRRDKLLSDGKYYNTILMGRVTPTSIPKHSS